MRRTLTAGVLAATVLVGGASPALAGPADRSTKELQQEISEYQEQERTPSYQLIPDCCIVGDRWGWADGILSVTLIAGAAIFYWGN